MEALSFQPGYGLARMSVVIADDGI